MRKPEDLSLSELQEFVRVTDYRTEKYDGDAVGEIRGLLADYGLASDVEDRVRGLVAQLDELIYDHAGTSKGASNQGYDAQVRALGIEETEALVAEVLEDGGA